MPNANRCAYRRPAPLPYPCFLILLLASSTLTLAQDPPGKFELSIRDEQSAQPTPARVVLADTQGKFYIADDAILVDLRTEDLKEPVGDLPLDKAQAGLVRRVPNPYNQTEHGYNSARSTFSLPPGVYRLTISKGLEYLSESRDVVVESGKSTPLTVSLRRWTHMAQRGWYSADAHLHIPRPTPQINASFSQWMAAEDLNVANYLAWGHTKSFHNAAQYAGGPAGIHQDGRTIIASAQENPRTNILGHTIILGAKSPINFQDHYLVYHLFWEEAARQGAVSGYAHMGRGGADTGLGIDLHTQLLSFLEVIQLGSADYTVWYNVLNSGFRLAPIAGTDYPFGMSHIPGRERFYTKVEGEFSHPAWLEGVRRGRTFATNGPMLEFTVDGHPIGDEVILDQPGEVLVEGTVSFDPARDDVRALELVENGVVVRTFPRDADQPQIRCSFKHKVAEAGWLALRVTGTKVSDLLPPPLWPHFKSDKIFRAPTHAHTGAIYLSIKGLPTRAQSPRAKALAQDWIKKLDTLEQQLQESHIEELTKKPNFGDSASLEVVRRDRPALLEAIAAARRHFTAQTQ